VICDWELGRSSPIATDLLKLVKILHTTPNALYGIADPNTTTQSDFLHTKMDLNFLLTEFTQLDYKGLPIPMNIRPHLIKTVEGALEMAGITKKNIPKN
jgi:hypothetical protein